MQLNRWLRQIIDAGAARRLRVDRSASRNRQRLTFRPWLFELLEDRALLAGLFGLHNIGPTGDFTSITAAISSIQANGLDGALTLELQPSYISTVETFPLVFSNLGTTVVNTISLRPELGATNLSITSADTTAATVDLNGSQYVTIDGRPSGAGSQIGSGGGAASQLTIANTSTSGVALRFINEASNNQILYTTFRGVNTSVTSGVVVIGTSTGPNGNDTNTIDHCDIRDGASTPTNGVYSQGTTATIAHYNSGNTVSNSNIFNFSKSSGLASGIRLDQGNTDSIIASNSFYQTAIRTAAFAPVYSIYIDSPSGNNFTVTGNFIGGSEPNAGGASWTRTGEAGGFIGIGLNVGTNTPSGIHGNTIRNFRWTNNANNLLPGAWSGIYVASGSVHIGTAIGNVIGSSTTTDSIVVTSVNNGITVYGIGSSSNGTVNIANNTIGSIATNSTTGAHGSIIGIQVTAGTNSISDNTMGSTSTANSLNAATTGPLFPQEVTGILSSSSVSTRITGNVVANLNNDASTTSAKIRGIVTSAGVNTILGNIVRNLATMSSNRDSTTSQSVTGIIQTSTDAGQTLSDNAVYSLANTRTDGENVKVTGIFFSGPTSGTNVIARNQVHSLAVSSSGSFLTGAPAVFGMYFAAGTFTVENNMVRLGVTDSGNTTIGGAVLYGIFDNGTTDGRHYYHNSVYLGGTHTGTLPNAYALRSTGSTNLRVFQNNIFVNARSNSTGTIKHYAVLFGGNDVNPVGLISNANIFFASGVGGILGRYNGIDIFTLANWQSATGQDATSLNADPLFVNPTGNATTFDLHLQSSSPALNAGTTIGSVTNDFDGQLRSLTAPDIGADELVTSATILNRRLFYNRSASSVFGNGSGNPIDAIDPTKAALLPGQAASFANYTNYVHGLNGLIVDVANLIGTPAALDFLFDTWNGINAAGFVATTAPATVTSIVGGGVSGSTRLKIEFPNGAISNTWLRVTMLANATTDLASDDVFYFGNAIGDMNAGNVGTPVIVRVNATDTSVVRQNQSIAANSVGVSSIHDVNKDGRVNATDTSIIRQNQNAGVIRFFDAPASLLLAESELDVDTVMADSSWLEDWNPLLMNRRGERLLR